MIKNIEGAWLESTKKSGLLFILPNDILIVPVLVSWSLCLSVSFMKCQLECYKSG